MEAKRALALFVVTTTLSVGCATQREAPFHVYQSPLLAAQTENPRPADRNFDPTAPGDFPVTEGERVVAQNDAPSVWEQEKPAKASGAPPAASKKRTSKPKRKRRALPLSSTRVGGRDDSGSSSAEAGDFTPALAAAYVHKTFTVNGVSLPDEVRTSVPKLWEACRSHGTTHQGTPLPGDAAFFHNAFDANADGRNNDWYTHVGIVEAVSESGTATILSWRGGKVTRLYVNPRQPDATEEGGEVVNSRLRVPTADDAPYTQYYAGQLFAGWCTMLDGKRDVVVIDEWAP